MKQTNYTNNINESELLKRLQQGDESAFVILYNNYRPQVYHVSLRYLKSQELAKEVVQDVFLKLWNDRFFLNSVLSIKAWIYKLSKNHILNRLKRLAIESRAKEYFIINYKDEDLATVHHLEDREYHKFLQNAIESLPEQQRRVFELARYEKLSYEAIARKMKVSPLTVKTHMSRALNNLRTKIHQFGVEVPIILFFLEDFF